MSPGYQKGMRGFGDQPGKRNDRWDRNLEKLEQPPLNKPALIRPVAGLVTVAVHYLKFPPKPGKKGGGFFTLCPNWDLEEGDINGKCPVCANFHRHLEVKSKRDEYLQMPQKLRYLFHAFHVSNIRSGAKDRPTFGLVETHVMGMESIEKAMIIKGNKPDEMKNGYCLVWLLSPSTKGSEYGPEVSFTGDVRMPVRRHAKKDGVWEIKIDGKVYEGVEQQIATAIPAPPTAEQLDKKIASMGLWEALDKAVGTGSRRATTVDLSEDLDAVDDGFGDSGTAASDDPDDPDADDTTWDGTDPDGFGDTGGDTAAADLDADLDVEDVVGTDVDDDPDGFGDTDDDAVEAGVADDDDPDGFGNEDPDAEDLEPEPEPEPEPVKRAKKANGKKPPKQKPKKEEPKAADADNWDDF